MTEYDIDDLDKLIKNYLDSERLTTEGVLEGLLDATPRDIAEEMIELQGIFTVMVHRIRDLEAINNELDRMLKLAINKRESQDLQGWVDENINPTDGHA